MAVGSLRRGSTDCVKEVNSSSLSWVSSFVLAILDFKQENICDLLTQVSRFRGQVETPSLSCSMAKGFWSERL